jgi:hypothetical protein
MYRKWGWIAGMACVVLVGGWLAYRVVSVALIHAVQASSKEAPPGQTVTPPERLVNQERLIDPNLDVQSRASLAEKLELQQRLEENRKAGEVAPAPKNITPEFSGAGMKGIAETPMSGIFPGSDGMVRPEEAEIINYWAGSFEGSGWTVLAGSMPQDPTRGVVIVLKNDGFSLTDYQFVAAPDGVEQLRVVSADNGTILLEDRQGKKVKFSLPSMRFSP